MQDLYNVINVSMIHYVPEIRHNNNVHVIWMPMFLFLEIKRYGKKTQRLQYFWEVKEWKAMGKNLNILENWQSNFVSPRNIQICTYLFP